MLDYVIETPLETILNGCVAEPDLQLLYLYYQIKTKHHF